jgi:hypothetical protein
VIVLGLAAVVLMGCGSPAPQPPAPAQPTAPVDSNNPAALPTAEKNNVEVGEDEPQIFMQEPEDGSTLNSPFNLRMGVANLEIPISDIVFYIAIDAACAPAGEVIQQDAQHVSLPAGQMENPRFSLPVGKHRLCIQAANRDNIALAGPGMTRVYDIEIVP